jgi:hypothetical protein
MRSWIRWLRPRAGVLLTLGAGCNGGTEPRTFTVVLSAPTRMAATRVTPDPPHITCEYAITARGVGGSSGDEGVWEGWTIEWRESGRLVFTGTRTKSEAAGFFGSDRIVRGEVRSGMVFNGSPTAPFEVTSIFHYSLPSGEVKSAATTTVCE